MKTNIPNQRLKIAVLIRHFNSAGGGAERYCVELTKKLAKTHEVHVFSQQNTEAVDDIIFHQIPQWLQKPRYINQLLFSYLTRRATQNQGFNIVHSHDMATHANIYTLHVPCVKSKLTQARGLKKVLRWFGILFSPRKLMYLWLEQREMRVLPDRHFISVSEYLSRNLIQNYSQLDSHITIAYPGINHRVAEQNTQRLRQNFKEKHNIPFSAFILLFAAHGFKRKGLPAIVNALEILDNKDIHLVVAGSGSPTEVMINTSVGQDNIHFVGVVKEMEKLYPAADAFIHPTLGDTYGMVVLEAMSHKLPVIVSSKQYCGFSEHLGNHEALILDNPRNADEIADKISQLFAAPRLRTSLSIIGIEKSQGINWDNTLQQTLNAYQQLKPNR